MISFVVSKGADVMSSDEIARISDENLNSGSKGKLDLFAAVVKVFSL